MPNDPLFDPAAAPAVEPTPTNGTPAAIPTPEAKAAAELADVRATGAQNADGLKELTGLVKQLTEQGLTPPALPQRDDPPKPQTEDEVMSELAADPAGTIRRLARLETEEVVGAQIAPQATVLIDTTHKALIGNHQKAVDEQYGEGTWREVYAPALADDLGQIRKTNSVLLASEETLQRLVDGATGRNMTALIERSTKQAEKEETDNKATMVEIAAQMPQSGVPRLAKSETVTDSDDFKLFNAEIERATGTGINKETFAKVHVAGGSLPDYLAAVKKPGAEKGATS